MDTQEEAREAQLHSVRISAHILLTVFIAKDRIPYHGILCVFRKNKRRSRALTEVAVIEDKGSFAEDNRLMSHAWAE